MSYELRLIYGAPLTDIKGDKPAVHVIILASPAEEFVGEAIDSEEMFLPHRHHSAKDVVVW